MSSNDSVEFVGGRNIAMKVPPHLWEETVRFYRDVVGLPEIENPFESGPASVGFEFGSNRLWIDRVVGVSQAEMWLQLTTQDPAGAAQHLAAAGVVRCDEIEPLDQSAAAFWISSPSSIVHLVAKPDDN